jgi:hypothetical protein
MRRSGACYGRNRKVEEAKSNVVRSLSVIAAWLGCVIDPTALRIVENDLRD